MCWPNLEDFIGFFVAVSLFFCCLLYLFFFSLNMWKHKCWTRHLKDYQTLVGPLNLYSFFFFFGRCLFFSCAALTRRPVIKSVQVNIERLRSIMHKNWHTTFFFRFTFQVTQAKEKWSGFYDFISRFAHLKRGATRHIHWNSIQKESKWWRSGVIALRFTSHFIVNCHGHSL